MTQVFLNSGGGVFGAIKQKVDQDQNLKDAFGANVRPGRVPPRSPNFPFVVMSHVSGVLDHLLQWIPPNETRVDRWDVWREVIQISVYSDNYEAARQYGRLMHSRISRQTFCADLVAVTLFPDSRILTIDPRTADLGADVWHYDFRYHFWGADRLPQPAE